MSDDRKLVEEKRRLHPRTTIIEGLLKPIKHCPFVPVGDGTIARIGLLPFINAERSNV